MENEFDCASMKFGSKMALKSNIIDICSNRVPRNFVSKPILLDGFNVVLSPISFISFVYLYFNKNYSLIDEYIC